MCKKYLIGLLTFIALSHSGYAQQRTPNDLDANLSAYQKFIIYPHIEKGLSAVEKEDYPKAIEVFLWARKRTPKSPTTALYLANAYIKNNEFTKAREVLEQQLAVTPKNVDILKRLSNVLIFEKDFQSASTVLEEQLKLDGDNERAKKKLNVVNQVLADEEVTRYKNLQKDDPALFYEELKDKKFEFSSAQTERDWIDVLLADFDRQQQLLLSYQPQFSENRIYLAEKIVRQLFSSGKSADAENYLSHLPDSIKLNPQFLDHVSYQAINENVDHELLSLLLEAYPFEDSSPTQRLDLMNRLILLVNRHPDFNYGPYKAMLELPLKTPAMRSLQVQLLSVFKDCSGIRAVLGDYSAFYSSSNWSELGYCYAEKIPGLGEFAFERASELDTTPDRERAVAYAAFLAKDYLRALTAWNSIPLVDLTASDILSAAVTAQTMGNLSELSEWLHLYEERKYPHNEQYWWLLAQTQIKTDPKAALQNLLKAAAIKPSVTYYSQIGALLMEERQIPEAIDYFEKALVLSPADSAVEASLGYAYYQQKEYKRANHYLVAALKARPDDEGLINQLAFTNQKMGQNAAAIIYAEAAIDNFERYSPADITPEIKKQEFGMRRMHEDLERRWSFTADAFSGSQVTASPNTGQPGANYRSYSQVEAAYRLGNPAIDDGKSLSAYSRIFAGSGVNNSPLPLYSPMIAGGLRWKPLSDYVLNLAVEEQTPLTSNQSNRTTTMLRASASFLNAGKYSDDWHPDGTGWVAQNLYLDAARYVATSVTSLVADYRASYHQKIMEGQTIEPYSHLQWTSLNQANGIDERIGLGVRWNLWFNENRYNAYSNKMMVGLEYQHAFKTYLNDKSSIFLTLGWHW